MSEPVKTKTRKSELETVQQTVRFFETLLRASADGIVITDAMQNIILVNEAFCSFFGRPRRDVIETPFSIWLEQMEPGALKQWAGLEKHVFLEGKFRGAEFKVKTKDGFKYLCVNASLLEQVAEEDRNVVISTWRDITRQKLAEEELKRAKAEASSIFQCSGDAIRVIDMDYNVFQVNDELLNILQIPADKALNMKCYDQLHGEFCHKDKCVLKRIAAGEERIRLETVKKNSDGRKTYFGLIATPLKIEGKNIGVIESFRDITLRKQNEEELQKTYKEIQARTRELTRSNSDLEQFAYVVSHDLQEPLRMIVSYLQLLEKRYKKKLDRDAEDFIDFAVDGATRMQKLIDSLLAYSRVATGGKPFKVTDIAELMEKTIANLGTAVEESSAEITYDPLPRVTCDEMQLLRLFQNLLGNAIKFRDAAPPKIHVGAEKKDSEWVFCVRDNGIGIAPSYFHRIFQIFQRLHSRTEYTGTGIGLAICKRIVERHNGRIWVESKPGEGAAFYFTIPVTGEEAGGIR